MSTLFVVQLCWGDGWEDEAFFETFDGALTFYKKYFNEDRRIISRTENILAEFKNKP